MSEPHEALDERPTPQDMGPFLEYACKALGGTFVVRVSTREQEEYLGRGDEKPRKSRVAKAQSRIFESSVKKAPSSATWSEAEAEAETAAVRVELVCERGRVVGVELRARALPCLLLRVLRLALDDSPALEHDHHLLLAEPCALRSLSLARCDLDDADCGRLAAALAHPRPASRTLGLLKLSSNRIGDEGARALARALRSNRTLRHLDLAGNRIADEGAVDLLRVLGEFPLTAAEVVASRRRVLEHLRLREEPFRRSAEEAEPARGSRVLAERGRRRTARRSVASAGGDGAQAAARARQTAERPEGPLLAPFGADETLERGGFVYCVGNCALVSLNLSYNELGAPAAAALLAALAQQAALARRPGPGLLRALLEGNPLPDGPALDEISEMLMAALAQRSLGAKRSERLPKLKK